MINIASSTAVPGHSNNVNGYMMEGRKDESFLMTTTWVDYDFLEYVRNDPGLREAI